MSDTTIDLNEVRDRKKIDATVKEVGNIARDTILPQISSMIDSTFSGKAFSTFIQMQQKLPKSSIFNDGVVSSFLGSIISRLLTEIPLEDAKAYLSTMADWIHESHVAQMGRDPFQPAEACVHLSGPAFHDLVASVRKRADAGDQEAEELLAMLHRAVGEELPRGP